MKTKELKQIGYQIEGRSEILMWGDDRANIEFTPFRIMGELDIKEVIMCINDGGFGCQKLLSAEIYIFELYEYDYSIYIKKMEIDKNELDDYNYINSIYIKQVYDVRHPDMLDHIEYM